VFAPAGTPQEIAGRLYSEIAKALNDPAMKQALKKLGANPMPLKPAEFEAFIRAEIESNAKLIKAAGITPN
jgi:tripartite-type tricarboxylate transporter receptor subunit TctC